MATGDIREIDMTKATNLDGKKIRLVGDDGKGYWIEKEDLAAVVGELIHNNMLLDIGGHDIDDYTENITIGIAGSGVSFVNDPFSASSGTRYFISLPFQYGACVQFCIQWSTGNLAIRSREVSSQNFKEWTFMK